MSTPTDPPLPPPIDRPPARKRSGVRIVIYLVLALGGLMVLTCGVAVYFAIQQPGVRETFEAAIKGGSAPGTDALRELGCQNAVVMDMSAMIEQRVAAEGEALPEGAPTLFVICQLLGSDADVGCDEAAAAYLGAVGEPLTPFVVQVQRGVIGRDACQVAYQRDGTRIGSLEDAIGQLGEEG